MVNTLCLSGAAAIKSGLGRSASLGETEWDQYITESEGVINVLTRKNWTDDYAGLNADVKFILQQVCSDLAAMYAIMYDMSGYTSRAEAQTMLDVLRDSSLRGLSVLRERAAQDFIDGA